MKRSRTIKMITYAVVAALMLAAGSVLVRLRFSGDTWYIRSAAVPQGWPELTPIGEVAVRRYPVYRAAVVADAGLQGDRTDPMFMELFRHIQSNSIAMTAPVDMGYESGSSGQPEVASMAFFYRTPELGSVGNQGAVQVRDFEPQTFASVGVRGDYNQRNFERGLRLLNDWLQENSDRFRPIGPPRYLGYNGPFVPNFMRYGEVQIPVEGPPSRPGAGS